MTTGTWVMLGAILLMVVRQLGWRNLTRRSMILPYLILAVMCVMYMRNIPTSNPNIWAMVISVVVGCLFGIGLTFTVKIRKLAHEGTQLKTGAMYLLLWVVAMGGRVVIAYMATNWDRVGFYHFMMSHHLSYNVIGPAFMLMTIAMIIVRSAGTAIRAHQTPVGSHMAASAT